MNTIHHSHLHRLLQDTQGNWKPMRIAYVSKGNGSISTHIVQPTSITNHGQDIHVSVPEANLQRTYKSYLIMLVTSPEDTLFQNPTQVVIN